MADRLRTRGPIGQYVTRIFNADVGHIGIARAYGTDAEFMGMLMKILRISPESKTLGLADDDIPEKTANAKLYGDGLDVKTGSDNFGGAYVQPDNSVNGGFALIKRKAFGKTANDPIIKMQYFRGGIIVRLHLVHGTKVWAPTKPLKNFGPDDPITYSFQPRDIVSFHVPKELVRADGVYIRTRTKKELNDAGELVDSKKPAGKKLTQPFLVNYIQSAPALNAVIAKIQIGDQKPLQIRPRQAMPAKPNVGGQAPKTSLFAMGLREEEIVNLPPDLPHGFAGLSLYELYGHRRDFNDMYGAQWDYIQSMMVDYVPSDAQSDASLETGETDDSSEWNDAGNDIEEDESEEESTDPFSDIPIGMGFDPYSLPLPTKR